MPPTLALIVWLALLLALFYFDPAKESRTSPALWIPVIWLFIIASRLPSQWLSGWSGGSVAQALEEGNPLDRTIFSILIVLSLAVLLSRSFKWSRFLSANLFLTIFVVYALASITWSDFPFIAFKRWFRDFGNYLVVLVALSDTRPLEAVKTLLRRVSYLVIPLSIVLDRYFPGISRQFDSWTGMGMYVGATTGKNLLGLVAMLSSLFFLWDTVARWPDRRRQRTKHVIYVNVAFLAMSVWLLNTANSATCRVCLAIGCIVVLAAHSRTLRRSPGALKLLAPSIFAAYLIVALGFGLSGNLATAVGKDPTLTDRTKIWAFVLGMHTNPIIGTGYESFWLGDRLQTVWRMAGLGGINEAHNGYLEVYLNLGWLGLLLILAVLITSYRTICQRLRPFSSFASLSLAIWTIMLFYSVTEVGFRSGLMWLVFLLVGTTVPVHAESRLTSTTMERRNNPEKARSLPARFPDMPGTPIPTHK